MVREFDIIELNKEFHLRSFLPRLKLKCPIGIPEWSWEQNKIILKSLFLQNNTFSDDSIVCNLENRIKELFGVKHCIALGSGRDAIKLALISMGLKEGDKVIIPSLTCLSVLMPILELRLMPVLADIGEDLQLDPESVKRVIQPGTKALIVPHLFGGLAAMGDLLQIAREKELRVIDDAAQAIGLEGSWGYAGSGGDAGIYSFAAFKPLSAIQGGALVTNDGLLYNRAIQLNRRKVHNICSRSKVLKSFLKMRLRKYTYLLFLLKRYFQQQNAIYNNSRHSENNIINNISYLDAYIVLSQIDKIVSVRTKCWSKAKEFYDKISQIPFLRQCIPWPYNGFPRWVVRINNQNSNSAIFENFFSFMLSKGIEVQPAYRPVHRCLKEQGLPIEGEFQQSEFICNKILCLPFSLGTDISSIISCINQFEYKCCH